MSRMNGKRHGSRWLDLAIRSRQWALDERVPDLQRANASELEASQRRERTDAAVADARGARDVLLSRDSFSAATLMAHSAFESELRRSSLAAQRAQEEAVAATQTIREEMQHALGERDAFRKRAEQTLQQMRRERDRVATREVDELWLLQCANRREGVCDEN